MGSWFEAYRCGCVSRNARTKSALLGYCPQHGEDRNQLFHGGVLVWRQGDDQPPADAKETSHDTP